MTDKQQNLNLSDIGKWISDFLQDPIIFRIFLPVFLLVLGWILKSYYDKYYGIRPKLFLKLSNPLYGQKLLGLEVGHILTWRYEAELKNNSKFDAYNIKLFELEAEDIIINNVAELKYVFKENNHLSSNNLMQFEIKKQIEVDADVLIQSRVENGIKYIIPGLKIPEPQNALKPEVLENIKLVVKFENEKGKKFYIKFTKQNGKETSKIKTIRPFWFNKVLK
ncbi:hypothetical protein SAMN05428642_1052 [Flaviramulus basaltis]|uniref:Uncharacterized protein n=1 Tax=Flaviramulus basaltis TaxID=369401 RepID=A0A1K2IQJ4_9FLAO|nr:hypothetical protein [Flaviramulus basaltis]SFZ94697.1 hypothetical protein SAMN05428642_1052 [Flaviramulus basaltis]